MPDTVSAWSEKTWIKTYRIGKPDKNPMFLEKRVYQGSSGVVYPHPVIDRIYDEAEQVEYKAVYLENRYLKLMILPEIGGRLQMALDKTNNYHFIYYNRVIKPALVGLAGPWISGGIEFNWPQHHRPSTFSPLEWWIQEHEDGSKSIWCSEIEIMFRTKGMHGFRLYPDRAYFEVNVQLYNRTSVPQTFLWWANPAVAVHDEYQTVFPPDVHAVMDHGKRDVSSFPIARGTYYKVDYSPGTDISRYKNLPVPTSYMVYHSDFNFMGSYDHQAEAGMLHIANHHIVPGKKQWTWGCGDFGKAWDRQLTDEDGPYIELMCGAYTDNQPDFAWIQPGEEKSFTQVFMPYKQIGPPCNANRDLAINLEINKGRAHIGVYASSARLLTVCLTHKNQVLYENIVSLAPEVVFIRSVEIPPTVSAQDLTISVLQEETLLLSYSPHPNEKPDIPEPATPARRPEDIELIEDLYLNGLHLEQYRHATYAPEQYYREALRRDAGDIRSNNALGLLLFRRGKFSEAEHHFRTAIARLTSRNPNPYDGEPYYNLGLALKFQGRYQEAIDAFHKAAWNAAWLDAAYYELACLSSRNRSYQDAIDYLQLALDRNSRHHKARHLKIALHRLSGQDDIARIESALSLKLDPMEYGALWEKLLLDSDPRFDQVVGSNPVVHIELALDYAHAGIYAEATRLLQAVSQDTLAAYTLGWVYENQGDYEAALEAYQYAATLSTDYCFPNRLEDILILESAQRINPNDANAPYYLGNLWYARRCHEGAIRCWEKSANLNKSFPTVHRNLGLAYFNKLQDPKHALECFELAFKLDATDARVLFELDQLYKRVNRGPQERLEKLMEHIDLVDQRDDLTIELVTILNMLGRHNEAYQVLMKRVFHPWEGGEGKVTAQYITCLVEKARTLIARGKAQAAIECLEEAQVYPPNLGEGKLYGARENNIFYTLGCAYEELGLREKATTEFLRAATGDSEPSHALYYNDQPPEMIFYQGLAMRKLGWVEEADKIFHRLTDYGQEHLEDEINFDYFAVSLPDFLVFDMELDTRNRLHCLYMLGLGALGLGDTSQAKQYFKQALEIDTNHPGIRLHLQMT